MQFKSSLLLALATSIGSTLASPLFGNPWSPMPGYPLGTGCLSQSQADYIVVAFQSILTNPNRQGANATAQYLIDPSYVESSDSINILAGYPLGGPSFSGKTNFINGVVTAPAIPSFTTYDIMVTCNKILWRWQVNGLGRATYPVKGFNNFVVANPWSGQLTQNFLEFNSAAWGVDIGFTLTPPGQ